MSNTYSLLNKQPPSTKDKLKKIASIVLVLLIVVGIGVGLKGLFSSPEKTKKTATSVKILLPDTPPPPPPPPKEPPKEQPKEQPKDQPTESRPEPPKPLDAPPAPAEQLNMEGVAGEGPSAFGSGAVNNDYKGGKVGTTIGGKKGLAAFAWYTNQIKSRIEDALAAEETLSHAKYRVVVHIWLDKRGGIEKAKLQGSSGEIKMDTLINKVLAELKPIDEAPPGDMPQPVKLLITSKRTG